MSTRQSRSFRTPVFSETLGIVARNAVRWELHLDYYGWGSDRGDHRRPMYIGTVVRGFSFGTSPRLSPTWATVRHTLGFPVTAIVSTNSEVQFAEFTWWI
jgi:hypothetical protein